MALPESEQGLGLAGMLVPAQAGIGGEATKPGSAARRPSQDWRSASSPVGIQAASVGLARPDPVDHLQMSARRGHNK
jgi:hypothetical protein